MRSDISTTSRNQNFTHRLFLCCSNLFQLFDQVLSVTTFKERLRKSFQLFFRNKPFPKSNLFNTGDFNSLPLFNDLYKKRSLHQRIKCSGIKPRSSSIENRNLQVAFP